eukprot:XP_019922757.1 PREDICTED: uncharacterized protein LOC105328143 [Crassostrea gigas]
MKKIHLFMGYFLLQIQISQGISRYCQEAVNSAESVRSCPTSEEEWEIAARNKNCSIIASQQNCSSAEKFQYHCVLNSYRNETLEVCAPSRIIFGHCVEFNLQGGVIQDQYASPCNDTFPKCDKYYNSSTAYKYPDCYQLASMGNKISSTTTTIYDITSTTTDESFSRELSDSINMWIIIMLSLSIILLTFLCAFVITQVKRRC